MLPIEFREALLERMLAFLWRQWSALGVLGESDAEDDWVIDPEPLLVFSLEIGRYEPRLFDEILAWLLVNGQWLDMARLKRILEKQDRKTVQVVGSAFQYVLSKGNKRKWQNITQSCAGMYKKQSTTDSIEPLFKERSGKPHPLAIGDKVEPDFLLFSINRPRINMQKEAKEVPVNASANLRFLLRSIFGIGAKSESILYLLTHEGARPREIADAVGLFWLGIQQILLELSRSGLVLTRSRGRKVEYWLSHRKWWDFLASLNIEETPPPKWLNWTAIFSALSVAWRAVDEMAFGKESDYMKSSRLQDSLEIIAQEFSRAGYDIPRIPTMGLPPDLHQKTALIFLGNIFGVAHE
jgi:hypothetical protein